MVWPWISLLLLASLVSACNLPSDLQQTVTALPIVTATPSSPWQRIEDGLEFRTLQPRDDEWSQLVVLRIDPQYFVFRSVYHAAEPKSLTGWRAQEPSASVIINANFFDQADSALGAIVSDGVRSGHAYLKRGGTFIVRNGIPSVLGYRAGAPPLDENTEQAIQGFPLLVFQNERAYFSSSTGERNRRTVIAEDRDGNILMIVAPYFGLSLVDLSVYLPATDLDIETAVNLDGGRSTMLAVAGLNFSQPSFDAVPAILAAYRR